MFDPTGAILVPNTAGGFTSDAHTVTHDFSPASNDLPNPINSGIGTEAVMNDFLADVDTVNDLRFKAKFIINPNPVQQQLYNPVALTTANGKTYSYLYDMSGNPAAYIPITRGEELTLVAAQIHLGMGDFAGALKFTNLVRVNVGGLTAFPGSVAGSYTSMRDSLMKEQRISTTWESSADRTIAIRMYGLALVADTTWGTVGQANEDPAVKSGDVHTTVLPIPATEIDARGGTLTSTCTSPIP
jgi:hypothetical protein